MSHNNSDNNFGYGAAIDAGSSGSRLYLYRWRWPKNKLDEIGNNNLAKVEQEAVFSEERTPGINDEHGIGITMLEELIALSQDALPPEVDPGTVPIYLGATAGMRIVDSSFEADIMDHIRSLLHESGFLFHDNMARTISGEEEAVYDWLVANYLKNDGNFPTTDETSYGALDLGGASTQISFPTSTKMTKVDSNYMFPLRIDNMEFPLYTKSFLHYGVDQARMQYDEKFAIHTKSNPCYPTGYADSNSEIAGSSNWDECLQSVAELFDCNSKEDGQRCSIPGDDGASQPPPIIDNDQTFIAMSAFVYTWDFLGLKIGSETDDLNALIARGQHICNMTHEQQMDRYKRYMSSKPLNRITLKPQFQCFNAAFSYHLLRGVYGMPESETPIEIHHDINGTKVQWALGLMLVEVNRLSTFFKDSGQQLDIYSMDSTYKALMVISIGFLIILSWMLAHYLPSRLKCRGPYLPLFNSNESKLPFKRKTSGDTS